MRSFFIAARARENQSKKKGVFTTPYKPRNSTALDLAQILQQLKTRYRHSLQWKSSNEYSHFRRDFPAGIDQSRQNY